MLLKLLVSQINVNFCFADQPNSYFLILSIYKFGLSVCLSVCLFVCLYPINVKTAEPIGPKFFVGHLGTPGKVYESAKFQIFENPRIFFVKIRELFLFCFTMYTKRTINLGDGREAPSKARKKGAKRLEFLVSYICIG